MNLDKLFESASVEINEKKQAYEITGMKKVIVKEGNKIAEFVVTDNFGTIPDDKSFEKLASKISKRFGDIETKKIITKLKSLKRENFFDNVVDLEIVDGKIEVRKKEEEVTEANIEIKDPSASQITIDGKPFPGNLGDLKAKYPKHFAALKMQLKKDGKTLRSFGGNNPAVDIVAKSNGTIEVNYDAK